MFKYIITAYSTVGLCFGSTVMAMSRGGGAATPVPEIDASTGLLTYAATPVPEIDASTGLLALAAVMASLVLAWELKRRRAS